jgi:hypothetical protein
MDFRLTVPTLASNCWTATPQEMINEVFDKTRGQLEGLTGVIIQSTTPDIDDQDKAWFKTDGAGRDQGYFIFGSGTWNRLNPEPALGSARKLWIGSATDVWSYDGGDGSDPSITIPHDTVGAMWEVDHDFDGRILMGPGTIPDITPPATLQVSTNYGNGTHLLTDQELAPHTHDLSSDATIEDSGEIKVVNSGGGAAGLLIGATGVATTNLSVDPNPFTTTQQEIPMIPPVRGIFVIKRTARTHYKA